MRKLIGRGAKILEKESILLILITKEHIKDEDYT